MDFDEFGCRMSREDYYNRANRPYQRMRRVDECAYVFEICEMRAWLAELGESEPHVLRALWSDVSVSLQPTDEAASWLLDRLPANYRWRIEVEPVPWPIYGIRWFFRCPVCVKRRNDLYAVHWNGPLTCRVCSDLVYSSSQEWDNLRRTGRWPSYLLRMMSNRTARRVE